MTRKKQNHVDSVLYKRTTLENKRYIKRHKSTTRKRLINSLNTSKILIYGAVFLLSVLIVHSSVSRLLHGDQDEANILTSDEFRPPSAILFELVDVNMRLMNISVLLKAILKEDPLAEIIKTRLRPVQERVASLRTQTRLYEQMGHIPGGPTNFMTTTLNELDRIIEDKIYPLDEQVTSLVLSIAERAHMASENFKEVRDSCSRLVGDTKSDQMLFIITEGFNIYPENKNDSESDESYLANHAMNISLMNVTSKLNILAHLYQWREQIALQVLKQLSADHPNLGLSTKTFDRNMIGKLIMELVKEVDVDSPPYAPLLDKLDFIMERVTNEISKNGKYYKLTVLLNTEMARDAASMSDNVIDLVRKKSMPYIELKNSIEQDIQNLKIRIHNMKYKYVKYKPIE